MQTQTQKITPSAFPIADSIVHATLSQLAVERENLFTDEMEVVVSSNPYLLAVVAQVANIFVKDEAEIACIQGALFIHHMVCLSSEEQGAVLPFVTEDDMLTLVANMTPTDESLDIFIAQEITEKKKKGDGLLFNVIQKAQQILVFQERELLAFCIGMILTYDVLQVAA